MYTWLKKANCSRMNLTGEETPAGPTTYADSHMFGSKLYEPLGYRWSERSRLETVLEGLPPREREAVRSRNGLSANGPWEEVYVVSSADMEADLTDFEGCLKTLLTMEFPVDEEQGRIFRVPRTTHIRDMISECLEPLYHRTPEVYDMTKMAFYDSKERARLRLRITSLLVSLYACQTLSMNAFELRAYLDRERKTACELERTQVFAEMVEQYKKTFV
jgi:hypothetical protein